MSDMYILPHDIAIAARNAGFRDYPLILAVAVAMAESGGNVHAMGTNPPTDGCPDGSNDRGLWQINDCYHKEVTNECAYDPMCCAHAAYRISNGGLNWTPWSTYNNGRYRAYLASASAAVMSTSPTPAHAPQRPSWWHMELKPWWYRNQMSMPVQAGYPANNRNNDCGPACMSMVYQHETGIYWSEDHILDAMFPTGHYGDVMISDLSNALRNILGLPNHVIYAPSQARALFEVWRALTKKHAVICCGYLPTASGAIPHYIVAMGMTPNRVLVADPAFGYRQVQRYGRFYTSCQQGIIIIDKGR